MNYLVLAMFAFTLAACGQLNSTDPTVGASGNSFPDARASGSVGMDAKVVMRIDSDVALPTGMVVVDLADQQDADPYGAPASASSHIGKTCTWQPPSGTLNCGDMAETSYYGVTVAKTCDGSECRPILACATDADCRHPDHRCYPLLAAVVRNDQQGCGECFAKQDCPDLGPCKKLINCRPLELRCIYEDVPCGSSVELQ